MTPGRHRGQWRSGSSAAVSGAQSGLCLDALFLLLSHGGAAQTGGKLDARMTKVISVYVFLPALVFLHTCAASSASAGVLLQLKV